MQHRSTASSQTDRSGQPGPPDEHPLISRRFILRLALVLLGLIAMTAGVTFGARWLGARLSGAGYSDSTELVSVTIGQDTLRLPANMIRFAEQRQSGAAERIDLYLTWPGMEGYRPELRETFADLRQSKQLIFLQISQSTMSKDMSGRVAPIYARLFDGAPQPNEAGLTLHRLKAESGYGDEVILTADRADGGPYAVRCLLPRPGRASTGGDCQRDIHIGHDLSVLYRFSSTLLVDWDHIDAAVRSFVVGRLGTAGNAPAPQNP
jgi:hypothetical protein